jgi:hypothetical protein
MACRMSKPVAAERLLQIGREIAARVEKLDKIGVKAVDHVDSIKHLLAEAEKLCETAEVFETFKQTHCPNLGRSRTYELLAIEEGRKSLEDIRASTRARVTKHRAAAKRHVTDKSSVTAAINGQSVSTDGFGEAAKKQVESVIAGLPPSWETPTTSEPIEPTAETSAEAMKAKMAALDAPPIVPAEQTSVEERRRAAARSHPRNASVSLKLFLNACYHFIPDLNWIELEKAEECFKQCAKEARKRAEKRKTDPPKAQASA